MRAVSKLCKPDTYINIVSVLNFGKIPRSYFYFLDMEFCEFNLDTYIQRKWTPEIKEKAPKLVGIDVLPECVRIAQAGKIMTDIAAGVSFIHSHKEIHRDLKPQNGIYSNPQNTHL
jgi:serine/threonine protein kinase